MLTLNNQQKYFEVLSKVTHPKNLKVAQAMFNTSTQTYTPGKRYDVTKYQIHDERTIAVNEIVFDFDWTSYKANYQKARAVIEVLDNRNIPYYICLTGGKGVHIHIFFNKIALQTKEGKEVFKEAMSYQFSFKQVRQWLWNTILDEAGIEEKYRKKQIDPAVLNFNYYSGTSHLIRDIGGRKYTKDSEGDWKPHYKTYVTKEEFNSKKLLINNFEEVKYPETINTLDIDENELISYLNAFVKRQKQSDVQKLTNERIKGKYTELDGVLKVREGMGEGHRSAGASVIAIACKIDNLTKTEAYEIMDDYVKNCSQAGSSFNSGEGKQWTDWIYSHDKPYWNCQLLIELGCHDRATCEHCQVQNKEALEFLGQKTILKQIKEVLDQEIVGEDDTKMLVFLLMLSKDFPSKTGKIGWNLPNDPASQNVIVSSDSASGKSWMIKRVLELFGDKEEDYFVISRMSKSAINYYTEINMDGKIIFVEEMQGLDENTSQLRVWMSEGELSFDTVEKVMNEEGVEVNAKVNKVTTGQPVFVTNQAEGAVGEQLNNRSWVMSMDASAAQTKSILEFQDKQHVGQLKIDNSKKRKIKDALKQLKPYHFVTYFADNKAMNIPLNDVRARRDYTKFLTLIRCSAYLHQHQRETFIDEDGNHFLICDIEDYDIARRYSANILGATFSGMTNNEIDLINHLKKDSWDDTFTIKDIMRNLNKTQQHWHGMLKQLTDLGYVSTEENKGHATIYSLVQNKTINIIEMPNGEELLTKIVSGLSDQKTASYKWLSDKLDILKKNKKINVVKNEEPLVAQPIKPLNNGSTEKIEVQEIPTALKKKGYPDNSSFSVDKSAIYLYPKATIKNVLEVIQNSKNHMVDFNEIAEKFEDINSIEPCLIQLKNVGDIFEGKPGKYIVL